MKTWVLLVECADRAGLVHDISGVLYRAGANVTANQEFVDREQRRFFMRTEFEGVLKPGSIEADVRDLLPPMARVRLSRLAARRVVLMVTREPHCLADCLVRMAYGGMNAEIRAVVGNHPDLGELAEKFGIPFHHVPVGDMDRAGHESALLETLEPYDPEYIVLARYMRVLSADFVSRFPNRIVNIHHSFLPAFAGAKAYHQAFARGVKVIGATAHFVTGELDAGPIIVQQVLPVDHSHSVEDLVRVGRDVEQFALAQALRLVFEDRVFLSGNRTILFD